MTALLANQHEATLGGMARHMLMVVKGTYHKCPLCFIPLRDDNILRHLNTHLTETQRLYPTYPFLGQRDELCNKTGVRCFVARCPHGPWELRAGESQFRQLREHLQEHTHRELAPYGINPVLLLDDLALASGGPRKSRVEVLRSLDPQLVGVLFHALHDSNKPVYQAMLGKANCTLQEASGTCIAFLEPRYRRE